MIQGHDRLKEQKGEPKPRMEAAGEEHSRKAGTDVCAPQRSKTRHEERKENDDKDKRRNIRRMRN